MTFRRKRQRNRYILSGAGLDKTSVSTDVIMLVKLDITNKNNILNIPQTLCLTQREDQK